MVLIQEVAVEVTSLATAEVVCVELKDLGRRGWYHRWCCDEDNEYEVVFTKNLDLSTNIEISDVCSTLAEAIGNCVGRVAVYESNVIEAQILAVEEGE